MNSKIYLTITTSSILAFALIAVVEITTVVENMYSQGEAANQIKSCKIHYNRLTKPRREQVKPQTKQGKIFNKKLERVALNSVEQGSSSEARKITN